MLEPEPYVAKRRSLSPMNVSHKRTLANDNAATGIEVLGSGWQSPCTSSISVHLGEQNIPSEHDESNTITDSQSTRQVVSSCPKSAGDDMLCFGAICNLVAQVQEEPSLKFRAVMRKADKPTCFTLKLSFRADTCWINSAEGEPFACLSNKISRALKRLASTTCTEVDILASPAAIEHARSGWKKSGCATTLAVDANIYGHAHISQSVAQELVSARLFLQPPDKEFRSLPYDNPQYLKLPDVSHIQAPVSVSANSDDRSAGISTGTSISEVDAVLDHLVQPNFLRPVSTDIRVITELQKHQKEAVDFITRKETHDFLQLSLWRLYCSESNQVCYRHVITGAKNSHMEDTIGGILADDMGLGKTLSMLASIVGSFDRAWDFARKRTSHSQSWQQIVPSKATLVIVPSALLLESWMDEADKHIQLGTLRVYKYHNTGKRVQLLDLLQHDVVLTTYATVAAEFCRGQSALHHIEWYRLVLDEAHVIRNASTKQFRAINALPAHIRWCLTGTPIQNSLDDLGAFMKFLKVPLFDDLPTFRKYIVNPVYSNKTGRFINLRRLLESICLRRTKSLLKLPEPATETQLLKLSPDEEEAYMDYKESCKRAIDMAVSGHSIKKANQHVIEALLRMRLFCNHGVAAFAEQSSPLGFPSDPEEAFSYLQTSGRTSCARCDCDISSINQSDDLSSGFLTVCHHLICGECLPRYKADVEESVQNGRVQCPLCGEQARKNLLIERSAESSTLLSTAEAASSTKLSALLRTVQAQNSNDKSVIFSFWKKTLDMVANIFDANDIPFYRIHGSLPAGKRSRVLSEFEESTSVRVLLITFGTGAVGINKLMVANHIHIVEPQWNPSVESQAIGRILRLGQERSVTIYRYLMEGTVEQAVQSRQLRKLQLARGGFGLSKDENTPQRVDEIMELLCPSGKT